MTLFILFVLIALVACGGEPEEEEEGWDCEAGTAGAECEPCDVGTFCAGGDAEAVACAEGMWDHDEDPATECVAWTDCEAGEFVSETGSETEDRQCADCEPETYSDTVNAAQCTAWTECDSEEYVLSEGTEIMDRECATVKVAGASCTIDEECESNECQRGYCKPTGWSVIPAGTFMQGSPSNETGRFEREGPQREVTISRAFFLQETPVTQAQWEELMGNNPSSFTDGDNAVKPVETVSWWDAVAYTNELSAAEGLEQCYIVSDCTGTPGVDYDCSSVDFEGLDCEGYRMPTEAEWEYAARAETTEMTYAGEHHGGDSCDASTVLSSIAWWCENSDSRTHPVGQKDPNNWGLYDMIGNVWEWTGDWDDDSPYPAGSVTDPTGPNTGTTGRAVRGCAWTDEAIYCRVAFGFGVTASQSSNFVGFRPIRSL